MYLCVCVCVYVSRYYLLKASKTRVAMLLCSNHDNNNIKDNDDD